MEVYIVRHTSVDVPKGIVYGQTDVPLRNTFPEEAAMVKAQLESLDFDLVATSPLSRAVKLATFCGYPDAERDERLKEINFGDWEWTHIYESHDPDVRNWFTHQYTQRAPNGESMQQVEERFLQYIDEKKGLGFSRICIFAHGGILLVAKRHTYNLNLERGIDIFEHLEPYGSIRKFEF